MNVANPSQPHSIVVDDHPQPAARRRCQVCAAFDEDLPSIETRIELASTKDKFGMPFATIHSYDQACGRRFETPNSSRSETSRC
jgi:hypothetical protein